MTFPIFRSRNSIASAPSVKTGSPFGNPFVRGPLSACFVLSAAACGGVDAAAVADAHALSPVEQQAMDILDSHLANNEFPGAVLAVDDGQGESFLLTSGTVGDTGDNVALDPETPWPIGSTTKTMVSVVVLQLVEEERLDLEQTIDSWFPTVPLAEEITVRNLLQHTSGLNDYLESESVLGDAQRDWRASEFIDVAVAMGALAAPDAAYRYCNTNYILLGEIIEKATGNPWYAEVRTRILDPLDMRSTHYPDEAGALEVGPGYRLEDGMFIDGTYIWHHSLGGATGGLNSTASDLLVFIRGLFEGELLSDQSASEMRAFIPADEFGHVSEVYGLGLAKLEANEVTVYGHMGFAAVSTSFFGFDMESGLSVSVLANGDQPASPAQIAIEVIAAMTDRDAGPPAD